MKCRSSKRSLARPVKSLLPSVPSPEALRCVCIYIYIYTHYNILCKMYSLCEIVIYTYIYIYTHYKDPGFVPRRASACLRALLSGDCSSDSTSSTSRSCNVVIHVVIIIIIIIIIFETRHETSIKSGSFISLGLVYPLPQPLISNKP